MGLQLLNGTAVVGRVEHRSATDDLDQPERRHGHLCPGPVDGAPADAHGRRPVRLLQYRYSRSVRGRVAVGSARARSQPLRTSRTGRTSARALGVSYDLFWDREDGDQGVRQPLRVRLRSYTFTAPINPLSDKASIQRDARLERRRERQPEGFHSAGRSAEPAAQRRVHGDDQPALRLAGRHDPLRPVRERGLGQAAVQLGILGERAARVAAPRLGGPGVLPAGVPQLRPSPTTRTSRPPTTRRSPSPPRQTLDWAVSAAVR